MDVRGLNAIDHEEVSAWGDVRINDVSQTVRIGVLNVGGLPTEDRSNSKMRELFLYINRLKLDIVGLTECNLMWKN